MPGTPLAGVPFRAGRGTMPTNELMSNLPLGRTPELHFRYRRKSGVA